jgi:hypothetical protein
MSLQFSQPPDMRTLALHLASFVGIEQTESALRHGHLEAPETVENCRPLWIIGG